MAIDLNRTLLGRISAYTLAAAKSFWGATVNTAWGLATFFILAAMINYYQQDASVIAQFFTIVGTLMENWQFVFSVLFAYELLVSYNRLTEESK